MNLTKDVKVTRVLNAVVAGSTDITTATVIDTSGFETHEFQVLFGAITSGAVTSIRLQESAASGSGFTDLAGTDVTVADTDDNKIARLEITKPLKRYLTLIVKRATQNAVVDGAICLQANPRKAPITQSTTVAATELHVSPIAGTA